MPSIFKWLKDRKAKQANAPQSPSPQEETGSKYANIPPDYKPYDFRSAKADRHIDLTKTTPQEPASPSLIQSPRPVRRRVMSPEERARKLKMRRAGWFMVEAAIVIMMAAFTVTAFGKHISSLNFDQAATVGMIIGALAVPAGMIWFAWKHSFDVCMPVRLAALIIFGVVGVIDIVHAAAVMGLNSGEAAQSKKEKVLKEELADLSTKQMGATHGKYKSYNQREIAGKAQDKLAEEIDKRDDAVKSASFASSWYLNGPMYGTMFLAVFIGCLVLSVVNSHSGPHDIDADFDGVPDVEQQSTTSLPVYQSVQPVAVYHPAYGWIQPGAGASQLNPAPQSEWERQRERSEREIDALRPWTKRREDLNASSKHAKPELQNYVEPDAEPVHRDAERPRRIAGFAPPIQSPSLSEKASPLVAPMADQADTEKVSPVVIGKTPEAAPETVTGESVTGAGEVSPLVAENEAPTVTGNGVTGDSSQVSRRPRRKLSPVTIPETVTDAEKLSPLVAENEGGEVADEGTDDKKKRRRVSPLPVVKNFSSTPRDNGSVQVAHQPGGRYTESIYIGSIGKRELTRWMEQYGPNRTDLIPPYRAWLAGKLVEKNISAEIEFQSE